MCPFAAAIAGPGAKHGSLATFGRLLVPREDEAVSQSLDAGFVRRSGGCGQPAFGTGRMTGSVKQPEIDLSVAIAVVVPGDGEPGFISRERGFEGSGATLTDLNGRRRAAACCERVTETAQSELQTTHYGRYPRLGAEGAANVGALRAHNIHKVGRVAVTRES